MPRKRYKPPPIPQSEPKITPQQLHEMIERQKVLNGYREPRPHDLIPLPPEQQVDFDLDAEKELAMRAVCELAKRKREALRCYAPVPAAIPFHKSPAKTRLLRGSNQSSKSTAAAAEVAWIVTGTHPYQNRFPKENGLFYCVGYDEKHIGELMWQKLARPGAYRIIQDEESRQWRPYNPNIPYDLAYKEKAIEADPLLPWRYIQRISWHKKKDDCPKMVLLHNGWRLNFFSSKAAPQQGTTINAAWIDEEIERTKWYPELVARCIVRSGSVIWSCTPLANTTTLYRLHQRANAPKNMRDVNHIRDVHESLLLIDDNPYLTQQQRDQFKAELTADEIKVRYYGDFSMGGLVVYPEFSKAMHCVPDFTIPPEWSRWMIVDPGVQVCAVMFAAIPPYEDSVHLYRELYIRRASASIFAERTRAAMGEYTNKFEGFIIDNQMARQTEIGVGRTILSQYSEELEKLGVRCRLTGSGFIPGSNDGPGRESSLRSMLEIPPTMNTPRLRVHENAMETFIWEMNNQFYRRPREDANIDERKRVRKNDHLVTCAEYLAAYDPNYIPPAVTPGSESFIQKRLRELQNRRNRSGSGAITLGPLQ